MDNTALLLIDYQKAFHDARMGARNNLRAEANAERLLAGGRDAGLPVIHVRHDSTEPGSLLAPGQPGNAVMAFAVPKPDEPVIVKSVNSAFIGTGLETLLRDEGIDRLVIAGVTTDHCVSTTTRMAANLGFSVTLAADACFTFDRKAPDGTVIAAQTVHDVELAILSGEFAEIASVKAVLTELNA
jgi:nicotinamidase-related amidase